ncbi:MAG: SIS domain-containing protein [Myxococcota bacterium]|nr:SIS domain-containing protein [Myxococcota bacterium]
MSRMLDESKEAAARVRDLLAADVDTYRLLGDRLRSLSPTVVATIARGSSDHVANYASYIIPQCTGRVVASIPPSVVSVLDAKLALSGQLALAVSQAGRSPDLVAAFQRAKEGGALTAAIVNDSAAPLAELADYVLPQHAGAEGIAATKTVLCSMAAVARLAAEWANDDGLRAAIAELPRALEQAHANGLELDAQMLDRVGNVYVLSRGLGLSAALETALKLKETCGVHAEAFSTAEVRHGPREIVVDGFLVIALVMPGSGRDDILSATRELEAQGGRAIIIEVPSGDARLAPLVALQTVYPWLARASLALGLDPDRPRTLTSKVIATF